MRSVWWCRRRPVWSGRCRPGVPARWSRSRLTGADAAAGVRGVEFTVDAWWRTVRWPSWLAVVSPGRRARARWRDVLPGTAVAGPPRRWLGCRASPDQFGRTAYAAGDGRGVRGRRRNRPRRAGGGRGIGRLRRGRRVAGPPGSDKPVSTAIAAIRGWTRWPPWPPSCAAGLPVSVALAASAPSLQGDTAGSGAVGVARRVAEAIDVAQTSGAPLADVLDRLDAHLRTVDRANAAAMAQAAGARASAVLLAVMPVAGIVSATSSRRIR